MSLLSDDDKALLVLEHLGPAALAGDTMSLYDCFQLALDVAEKAVLAKLAGAELPEPAYRCAPYSSIPGAVASPSVDYYTANQLSEAHAQGFAAGAAAQLAEKPSAWAMRDALDELLANSCTGITVGFETDWRKVPLYTRREAK